MNATSVAIRLAAGNRLMAVTFAVPANRASEARRLCGILDAAGNVIPSARTVSIRSSAFTNAGALILTGPLRSLSNQD